MYDCMKKCWEYLLGETSESSNVSVCMGWDICVEFAMRPKFCCCPCGCDC